MVVGEVTVVVDVEPSVVDVEGVIGVPEETGRKHNGNIMKLDLKC